MKKIVFALIIALFSITAVMAQDFKVIPKAKLEYDISPAGEYLTVLDNPVDLASPGNSVWMGRTVAGVGIEFAWRELSAHFDTETYMVEDIGQMKFNPIQSNYKVRLQYAFKRVRVKGYIEHACFHSIGGGYAGRVVEGYAINGYRGGYTRIGISYNY